MPTYKKIPPRVKKQGAVAIGRYGIFCSSVITAAEIATTLGTLEDKKTIPMVGYVTRKGQRIYYCLQGLLEDPIIYS